MRRNQRAPDFGRDTAFLDEERLYLARMMKRNRAKGSGCLLHQAFLWLLLALVAVCWPIYAASSVQSNPSPTFVPMLVLGSFLPPAAVASARRWVYRVYYRRSIIIGARVSTTT